MEGTRMKRSVRAVIAMAMVGALALTGCSRGEGSVDATSEHNATNKRIVSLGLGDADTLLALGIKPVAVAPWGAEGDNVTQNGVGPWSQALLGEAQPTPIYQAASGMTTEILEKVTAENPDQIIAVNQAVDAQAKQSLEEIAPTTVKPAQFPDWQVPWKEQVRTISQAVNKQKEGDQLIAETDAAMEAFRKAHPELAGKKVAVVMPYAGKLGLYTHGDGRGQFVEDLGMEIPDELEAGDPQQFYRDIAPENYNKLNDLDYLFVLDYNDASAALKQDATFTNLDVVKSGKVRYFQQDVGNAMSMPNPVTIPWAVTKFEAAL